MAWFLVLAAETMFLIGGLALYVSVPLEQHRDSSDGFSALRIASSPDYGGSSLRDIPA